MKQIAILCGVLAACSDGSVDGRSAPDLSGMYKVTEQVIGDACTPTQPVAIADVHYLIEPDGAAYQYRFCARLDPASCQEFGMPMDTPIDNGWQGGFGGTSGDPPTCELLFTFAMVTQTGPYTVVIEESRHSEEQAPCDRNEALRRGRSMPCVGSSRETATFYPLTRTDLHGAR